MVLIVLSALLIGACLGFLGAGGSIVTLPLLVFLLQRPEKVAVSESLAIVCLIALVAALPYVLRRQVHWKSFFFFGMPGLLGAYLGACCSSFLDGTIQLLLFGFVLLGVAWTMLFKSLPRPASTKEFSLFHMICQGFFIGSLTGLIGVGGGFLIVPALILLVHLEISVAIGTSLLIIALNAGVGFIKHLLVLNSLGIPISGKIIAFCSILGIMGSLLGGLMNKHIPQTLLRKVFGWCMMGLGIYILVTYLGNEIPLIAKN